MVSTRSNSRSRIFGWSSACVCLGLMGLSLTLSGCKKPDEIQTYTVPHREPPQLIVQRMLGAIIPNDKEAWFFKLQGEDEAVTKLLPDFLTFTKSVEIKAGKVTWKAPESWKERAGGEFRITTFLVPQGDAKPLELAITRLDASEGVNDKYLQANLSRWRGQLGLDPIEPADIPQITTKVKFQGGEAWVCNFAGMPAPGASMAAPFAPPVPSDHPPLTPSDNDSPPAIGSDGFQFETPKGWSAGKVSSMRKASLAVVEGDTAADISVFAFPADANDLLSNVNRWRGQVGLKETSADELQKTAKKIEVSGHTGEYVELMGEKDTILGVMVKKGDSAWFFKLQGPTTLAVREKTKFEEFVKSSRLP